MFEKIKYFISNNKLNLLITLMGFVLAIYIMPLLSLPASGPWLALALVFVIIWLISAIVITSMLSFILILLFIIILIIEIIIKAIEYSQKLFNKAKKNIHWYHIWWLAIIVEILLNFLFPHIILKITLSLIALFPFTPWARKILKKLGVKNID